MSSTNMEILRQLGASGQDQQQKAWYDAHKDEFKGADQGVSPRAMVTS